MMYLDVELKCKISTSVYSAVNAARPIYDISRCTQDQIYLSVQHSKMRQPSRQIFDFVDAMEQVYNDARLVASLT
jgi:hypothetical protein